MHVQYANATPEEVRLFPFPPRNLTPGPLTKRIGLAYKNTRYTEVVIRDILDRQGEQMTFYEANETQSWRASVNKQCKHEGLVHLW